MPNHWHQVLWPEEDGALSRMMHWMTMTHAQRWRHHRNLVGLGPLYQGRFKAFPVEEDLHLLVVLRYVERNALRAGLVKRAELWRYSSVTDRLAEQSLLKGRLHEWPIEVPRDYLSLLNTAQTDGEEAVRMSIRRGRPFGAGRWQELMIRRLGLESSVNPPHRVKRDSETTD